jgi:hypothetical protein
MSVGMLRIAATPRRESGRQHVNANVKSQQSGDAHIAIDIHRPKVMQQSTPRWPEPRLSSDVLPKRAAWTQRDGRVLAGGAISWTNS